MATKETINVVLKDKNESKYITPDGFTHMRFTHIHLVKTSNITRDDIVGLIEKGKDLGRPISLSGSSLVEKIDLSKLDFTRADLRFLNLEGANLKRANLTHARLEGANLTNADLTRAELLGTDFTNADIRGVLNLEYARDVGNAIFKNTKADTYTQEMIRQEQDEARKHDFWKFKEDK